MVYHPHTFASVCLRILETCRQKRHLPKPGHWNKLSLSQMHTKIMKLPPCQKAHNINLYYLKLITHQPLREIEITTIQSTIEITAVTITTEVTIGETTGDNNNNNKMHVTFVGIRDIHKDVRHVLHKAMYVLTVVNQITGKEFAILVQHYPQGWQGGLPSRRGAYVSLRRGGKGDITSWYVRT